MQRPSKTAGLALYVHCVLQRWQQQHAWCERSMLMCCRGRVIMTPVRQPVLTAVDCIKGNINSNTNYIDISVMCTTDLFSQHMEAQAHCSGVCRGSV